MRVNFFIFLSENQILKECSLAFISLFGEKSLFSQIKEIEEQKQNRKLFVTL